MINKSIKSLRRHSKPYVREKLTSLEDLICTMRIDMINNNGVGISAVQVGTHARVCIVLEEVIINPIIVQKSMFTTKSVEGCLSLPDVTVMTERHKRITIKYLNEKLERRQKRFEGFAAIVLQHELDHLNGKLITDRGKKICNQ